MPYNTRLGCLRITEHTHTPACSLANSCFPCKALGRRRPKLRLILRNDAKLGGKISPLTTPKLDCSIYFNKKTGILSPGENANEYSRNANWTLDHKPPKAAVTTVIWAWILVFCRAVTKEQISFLFFEIWIRGQIFLFSNVVTKRQEVIIYSIGSSCGQRPFASYRSEKKKLEK